MTRTTTMRFLTLALLICSYSYGDAQSVGINTRTPDPSAVLDITSGSNKGLLIPRMKSSARIAIPSPANGLLVYDLTTNTFWYFQSETWIELIPGSTRQSMAGVFENNSGVVRNTGNHASDDFVFGAGELPPATAITDTLMFFDKSKAAFRAGYLNSNSWAPDSLGRYSFASGYDTKATGDGSTAMGASSRATGFRSTAIGNGTRATGTASTATGSAAHASGDISTAMGFSTLASGAYSTAMGDVTLASGQSSTAMGQSTVASGSYSTAMGQYSTASGLHSTALGNSSVSSGSISTAMGRSTASGIGSTSMGLYTEASGDYSTATGFGCEASGDFSSAIGTYADAVGMYSTSMGNHARASGISSTALGYYSVSSGVYSTAMGYTTEASGPYATAMGHVTTASGTYAFATGLSSIASGYGSTAMGLGTKAESLYSTAIGRYNIGGGNYISWISTDPLFELGNGSGPSSRNNALTILKNGNMGLKGNPDTDLHLFHANNGNASGMKLQNTNTSGNWVRMYVSSGDGFLRLYSKVNGTTIIGAFNDVTGAYTSLSDSRMKKNMQQLHFDWNQFNALKPLTYQYKTEVANDISIGMIAQDVNKIYPELVHYFPDEDLYHLDYSGFGVIAIKAIQELKAEAEMKDQKINELESRLLKLEQLMGVKK